MGDIIITIAGEDDFEHVSRYVKQAYKEKFGTDPEDPHVYIVAKRGATIIGTAGVELHDEYGALPIQYTREFSLETQCLLAREQCAQFGRWNANADEPLVSLPLVYAVSLYAKKYHHKRYAIIEQGDAANRILRKRGIAFVPIQYSELHIDRIPVNDLLFYQTYTPKPYLMELSQVLQALAHVPLLTTIAFQ